MHSLTLGDTPTYSRLNLVLKIDIFRSKMVKSWYFDDVIAKNKVIKIIMTIYHRHHYSLVYYNLELTSIFKMCVEGML